jgi:hypothetical protein
VRDAAHTLFHCNISSIEMDKASSQNGSSLSLSEAAQCRGLLGRAPLLGALKDMSSKALAWKSVSTVAPLLGNKEERCFRRALEINMYISRDIEKCPISRYLSP